MRMLLPLLTLVMCHCFVAPAVTAAEWKDKAEADGKVILYTTMTSEHAKLFMESFRQFYPKIDAQSFTAGSSPLAERILTEARTGNFLWDVLLTTPFYTRLFIKRGLITPYESPERKYYREGYKDPKGMWTSIYTNYTALGYNARLLPGSRIPKSHFDLLKPEWRQQIGMDNRPYEWFVTFVHSMGEEKGLSFMRALAQQEPQLRTGRTLIAQLVAAGEVLGGLTAFSQNFENLKRNGAPVEWIALDPVVVSLTPSRLRQRPRIQTPADYSSIFSFRKKGRKSCALCSASRTASTRHPIPHGWLRE